MVCGGECSNRIELFNPSENGFTSCVSPASLPESGVVNAVLFGNRLITLVRRLKKPARVTVGN